MASELFCARDSCVLCVLSHDGNKERQADFLRVAAFTSEQPSDIKAVSSQKGERKNQFPLTASAEAPAKLKLTKAPPSRLKPLCWSSLNLTSSSELRFQISTSTTVADFLLVLGKKPGSQVELRGTGGTTSAINY